MFLYRVAQDLLKRYGNNLSGVTVVFPNKRASLFMNKYLNELSNEPVWSPAYTTISELLRSQTPLAVADPIMSICLLYKVFTDMDATSFTLDQFYGWGQMLLADFDDVDKNMADADKVFQNVSDLKELDTTAYLDEEQKKAIKLFYSNFSDTHDSELRQRFLKLWSRLGDIYHNYRKSLREEGLAYEGMLYRDVAETLQNGCAEGLMMDGRTYAFVGFNMLQKSEQVLFRAIQQDGRALFYWDLDHYYIKKEENEAGFYIRQAIKDFPSALDLKDESIYGNFGKEKDITYISAPTETMQARYVTTWLQQQGRMEDGVKTAIVLADENLLPSVLRALPPGLDKVNITTGYPLGQTQASVLVALLMQMHTAGRVRGRNTLRIRYVSQILRHPYIQMLSEEAATVQARLMKERCLFPTPEMLCKDELLELIFSPLEDETKPMGVAESEQESLRRCLKWLTDIVTTVARKGSKPADPLFQESLFRTYTMFTRLTTLLDSKLLTINISTLNSLIHEITATTSIPFHGEPAEGVQIMGMLETRNLDFDHVLLLSANEGNLPKKVSEASLIPHTIRHAYGLTTVEHKVAIYAYYFMHLMQRSTDVSIAFNVATTETGVKEKSRFLNQMMVESDHSIRHIALQAGKDTTMQKDSVVMKTPAVMKALYKQFSAVENPNARLSPSAIAKYMRCPMMFFYKYVAGLKEVEEIDTEIDNIAFGNVFHKAAEIIYKNFNKRLGDMISADEIDYLLKSRHLQEKAVDEAFLIEFFNISDMSQKPDYNGLQLINRNMVLRYLRTLLEYDKKHAPFSILCVEGDCKMPLTITPSIAEGADEETKESGKPFSTFVGGKIDRLDMVCERNGQREIRVVDYKTGNAKLKGLPMESIFDPAKISEHADYYLQTMLYCCAVVHNNDIPGNAYAGIPVTPNLLFVKSAGAEDYNPVLKVDGKDVTDIREVSKEYKEGLQRLLAEIFSPSVPFRVSPKANDPSNSPCKFCPYTGLCHR